MYIDRDFRYRKQFVVMIAGCLSHVTMCISQSEPVIIFLYNDTLNRTQCLKS